MGGCPLKTLPNKPLATKESMCALLNLLTTYFVQNDGILHRFLLFFGKI